MRRQEKQGDMGRGEGGRGAGRAHARLRERQRDARLERKTERKEGGRRRTRPLRTNERWRKGKGQEAGESRERSVEDLFKKGGGRRRVGGGGGGRERERTSSRTKEGPTVRTEDWVKGRDQGLFFFFFFFLDGARCMVPEKGRSRNTGGGARN